MLPITKLLIFILSFYSCLEVGNAMENDFTEKSLTRQETKQCIKI
jgi:hypothetical protein